MGRSAKIRHRRRRRDHARSARISTIDAALDRALEELAASAKGSRRIAPGARDSYVIEMGSKTSAGRQEPPG